MRFGGKGYFALEDPERLTIFADYILPVALRRLGILSYSDALERASNARRLTPSGSEEEIEIRAASICACHLPRDQCPAVRPTAR